MKYTIPMLLASTIIVGGIFALMPVQEATTTHNQIFANTVKLVDTEFLAVNTLDQDIRITCPATSDGCRILEVYLTETANVGNAEFDDIDLVIDGTTIANAIDIIPDDQADGVTILITEAAGLTLGNGDSMTIDSDAGNTDDNARYTIKIIGIIEGDTADFTIAFVN